MEHEQVLCIFVKKCWSGLRLLFSLSVLCSAEWRNTGNLNDLNYEVGITRMKICSIRLNRKLKRKMENADAEMSKLTYFIHNPECFSQQICLNSFRINCLYAQTRGQQTHWRINLHIPWRFWSWQLCTSSTQGTESRTPACRERHDTLSTRSQTNDSEIHLSTNLLSQPMFCPYRASLSHSQFFVWATQTLHNSYAVKQNHIPLTCFRDYLLINIEVTSVIMNAMFSLPHCEDHWETGQF